MRNAAEVGPASASRLEASSLNRQPLDRSAGAGESDAATRESGTAAGVRTSRFLASRYERGVDVEVGARVGTRSVYAEEGFRAAGFSVTNRPLRGDASRGALEDSKLVPAGVPSSGSAFLQVSGRDSTSPESARAAGGMNVSDRQAGLDDRGRDFGSARSTFSPSAAASRRQLYSFVSVSRSSSQHATALASRSPLHGLEKFSTTKDSALRALTSALTPHHREDLRHGLASQVEGNGALGTSGRPETQGAMRDANLLSSSALGDSDPIRLELGEDRENKNASSRLLNCDDLTSSAELSATALRSRAPVETRRLPADGASHFATSFSRSTVFQGSSGGALGDASSRVAGSRAVARERAGAPAAAGRSVDAARELPAEDEALFSPESSVRLRAQQPATFSSQLEAAAKMHANAADSCSREGSPAFLPSSASHAPFAAQSALGVSSSRPSFLEERHRDKASDSFLSSSLRSGTPSGAPLDAMERSSPARVHASSSLLRTSSSSSFSSVSQRPFSLAAAASAAHSRRTDALLLGGRAPRTAAGKEEGRENEEGGADRFASTGLGETAAAEAPTGSARTGSGGYMSHLLLPSFPSLHRERADKAADDMLQRKEEGDMRSCSMQEKDKDASVSSHSLSSAAGRRGHGGAATTRSFSQPATAATQPASSQLSHRSRYVDRSVTQPPLSSAAEEGARSPAFLPLSLEGCESAAARAVSSSSVGARSEELFVGGPRERERSLGGGVPGRKEDAVSSAAPGATARPPSGAAGTNSLSRFATATESGESVGGISTRTPPSSVLSSRAPPSSVSRLGEEPLDAGDKAAALFPFSAADQRRASQQSSRSAMSFHLSAENGGAGGLVSKTSSVSLLVGNAGAGKLETAAGKGSTVCVCQASRYMARQKAHYEQQLKRVEEERQQQQQRRRILAEQETQVSLLQTQVQRQREGVTEEEKQLREMRSQLTEEREAMERRWQQLEKQHQDLVEKKEKWRQTAQHKRDELQAFSQRIRAEKKELDDRKKEIARDTANLKERSESVEREQDNLNRQRVELEEVRFSLDRAKAELDARISATDDERRRVKKREEEVLRRGEDLQTKEEELGRERLEVEKRQEALALKADEDERRELERDSLWRKKNEELDRRTRAVHEQEKEMDARSHELRRQEAELKREEDREKKKLQQLQEAFLEEQKNFAREKGRIEAELEEEKKRTEEERRRDEAEREQARKRIENERKSFELFLEEERARWDAERRRAEGEFEEAQRVWNQERKSREADLAAAQESVAKRAEELEKEEKQKREDFEAMTVEFQKEKEKITRQLEAEQEQMREELGRERERVVEEKRRAQEDLERTRNEFEAEKSREMQELHDQMERLKEKQAELEALQERWEAERLAVEARLREEQERLEGERQVLAQERDAFEEEVHRERAQFREEREAALAELQAQRRLAERELGEQKAQQEDVFEEERQRLMQVEEKQQETYAEQMKQLRNLEEEVHQQKLHHQQDVSRHLSREEALFERERRMREEEQSVQEERQRLTKEKQEIAHQRRQLEDEQSKQKEMEAALRREREDVEKKTEALREQMEQVAQVDEKFARAREAENALEIERAALEAEKESFSREKELIDAQVGAWRRKLSQREQEVSRREREASTRLRDIETQERVHKVRMEEEAAAGRGFARHTQAGSASSSRRGSTAAQREVRGLWPDGDTKKAGSSSRTRTRSLSVERRQAGRTPSNASASGIPLPKSVAARRHLTPVGGIALRRKA
ncbi:hypothetical protein BESB_019800 [Besnoitia besnoiti]|uniref:Uncharacterized protein n=1 Tax=Besnoitia besnoiti TaxID=94643 RepID=A0A2A9M250_BESBE|nr:hypothetical protein BESB_019800 [Besnoitia besnoiti]PFH32039.1 hypothetical protein BESB_019800 [Besnoitia besnoiti]